MSTSQRFLHCLNVFSQCICKAMQLTVTEYLLHVPGPGFNASHALLFNPLFNLRWFNQVFYGEEIEAQRLNVNCLRVELIQGRAGPQTHVSNSKVLASNAGLAAPSRVEQGMCTSQGLDAIAGNKQPRAVWLILREASPLLMARAYPAWFSWDQDKGAATMQVPARGCQRWTERVARLSGSRLFCWR